jgi:solute carrier family 44 protein 1 (choline transporter-like protein)
MQCWVVLVVSCGITLGTAALYLLSLRYLGCLTVILSTIGIQTILTYAAYRLLVASADPQSAYTDDPAMRVSVQFGAVIMSCGAILFALFAVVSMPRLLLAGAFITHASRALSQLKKLLLIPFVSYGALILLFWWGVVVTICLFGAGETSTRIATVSATSPATFQIETESFRVSRKLRWLFLYHAWGMYWSANFIIEIGEMITATAVSLWYFSPENRVTGLKDIRQEKPVMYAVNATLHYHLGTLALSSGVVGPVEYIRAFFLYLENKNEFDANALTETLAKCCCVRCSWPGLWDTDAVRGLTISFAGLGSAAYGASSAASSTFAKRPCTSRLSRAPTSTRRER